MSTAKQPLSLDAGNMKDALARRHPAISRNGTLTMLGAWTVTFELWGIDVLALSAHKKPPTGAQARAQYPRVGYEVKISRADFRRELLQPDKRLPALTLTHEFYLAVPAGLLTADELAFQEPDWQPGDFDRTPCPGFPHDWQERRDAGEYGVTDNGIKMMPRYGGPCVPLRKMDRGPNDPPRGTVVKTEPDPQHQDDSMYGWRKYITCPTCDGKGYLQKSRVERDAPTLWIPNDCGLVEVLATSTRVVRKSPVRTPANLTAAQVGELARWISVRPDPRHDGVVDGLRENAAAVREQDRVSRQRNSIIQERIRNGEPWDDVLRGEAD